MIIAFHNPRLCIRGTSVALYDYARYNEEILNNKSIIIVPLDEFLDSDMIAIKRFSERFLIYFYKDRDDMENILVATGSNILYCIKYGNNDGVYSNFIKTGIHCVFDMSEPHGDVYAGVSEALARKYNNNLFVPHMVSLKVYPTNLRESLGISHSAIIFGRYGGLDTFNLEFCQEVIREIVDQRKDIYFLFINTPKFIQHKQVIYLEPITDEKDKSEFINTCDAHLECGTLGHSFGNAIAEFSIHNKPIIAYNSPTLWNTAHIEILKDKGVYFSNREEFKTLLLKFNRDMYKDIDMNCYKEYSPENVMKIFEKVFL